MTKIKYDPEVQILTIRFNKNKIVDSDVKSNVVIDYDKDGEIVSLEILSTDLEGIITEKELANLSS